MPSYLSEQTLISLIEASLYKRERERECESVCVCVCVWERESVCVIVCNLFNLNSKLVMLFIYMTVQCKILTNYCVV